VPLETPPELAAQDGSSTLLTSLLPMIGSLGAVAMVALTGSGKGSYIAACMFLLSSLGFVGVNGWRQRSQGQAAVMAARREYLIYLADLRATIRQAAAAQRRHELYRAPTPDALVYLAEDQNRVWTRSNAEADFLEARCGVGVRPLSLELEPPEIPTLANVDPISASACQRFISTHSKQRDLPVTLQLRDHARVELVGADVNQIRSLARALICQLATFHSPDDLRVAVLAEPEALEEWEWAKWLPHAQSPTVKDGVGSARMIAPVLSEITDLLPAGLADRPRFAPGAEVTTPHLLVVLDGCAIPPGNPALNDEGVAGVTVMDLPAQWGQLDDPHVLRLEVGLGPSRQAGTVDLRILQTTSTKAVMAAADGLTQAEAEATARRLARIASGASAAAPAAGGKASAELTDLLRLGDVRDIDLDAAWRPRAARDRLRTPIGLTPEGRPVALDIKESAQQGMGPHGLIIGATGSGKSEVLRTLVAALALTHSPEALNFVLIDFKGGATFNGMADMPHVSAIITNLGDDLSLVDRMQDALLGEMVRRQELLRDAGNFTNVSAYNKARADRPDLAPLPALLIVADEFSELLSAKPEFAETFVQIGRLGRSLEVHLLLSSQRLEEAKLRGLESHLSYRIGLKTFSAAESRTVLGVPDAYELPSQPGAGYLKPDPTNLIRFRAAYVSGPPPRRRRRRIEPTALGQDARVEFFTAAPVASRVAPPSEPVDDEPTQDGPDTAEKRSTFEIAVSLMAGRGPKAHAVWLDPLTIPATLDELMPDLAPDPRLGLTSAAWRGGDGLVMPVGLVDKPMEQRRDTMTLSLSGASGHMAVVGGPRTGKSTALRTAVAAMALTRTPLEVQFYVLDFGGGTFTPMSRLAHVAGVAARTEGESVRRIVAEVRSILNAREAAFRDQGIDSIETYRLRRERGQADDGYGDVFLIIDGWGTVRGDFEELVDPIADITARGLTYGVHVVISAVRWLEIRQNIADLLGARVELRLGDPTDSIYGRKLAENVPAAIPGRGLTPTRHHMMIALPRIDGEGDTASLSDGVDHLISHVNAAWRGPAGPKLRLLPTMLTLDELRQQATRQDAEADEPPLPQRILLGVDEANLAPTGLDASDHLLYLYGDSGSGKSAMLRAYAHEVMRLYSPDEAQMFVVDYRRSLLGDIPPAYLSSYITTGEAAGQVFPALAEALKQRLPPPDVVTPEQLAEHARSVGKQVFVLVDDYDLVATSQGNPLARLADVLPQAADVGLHLALVRHSGGASRAAFEPLLQKLTDLGATGILLSGDPEEGPLIRRVKAEPAVPGRAKIISRAAGVYNAQLAFQAKTAPTHRAAPTSRSEAAEAASVGQ
jgi:S-DNA-T family DNA segregation ATPase FtsK/SpoIIIE